MPHISITPEGASIPQGHVVDSEPARITRAELFEIRDLVLWDGRQQVEVEATGILVPLNQCWFAKRTDLIVFDPDDRQFIVYQGEPHWGRPVVPRVDDSFFRVALVTMPSRWGRFWRAIWHWVCRMGGLIARRGA